MNARNVDRDPATMACTVGGQPYWTATLGEHIVCPQTWATICTQDCVTCEHRRPTNAAR